MIWSIAIWSTAFLAKWAPGVCAMMTPMRGRRVPSGIEMLARSICIASIPQHGASTTGPAKGFTTWPQSVKYSVTYRKINDRYFLNHVRGDLVFLSKQKRKLFNSQFRVFFELAVTSVNTEKAFRFDRDDIAPVHSVFSSTIADYDAKFWGDQDFLKPEENLMQALKNLKVRLQEFSERP